MNQNPYRLLIFNHTTGTTIIIVVPACPFVHVKIWIFQSENVIFGQLYLPLSITHISKTYPTQCIPSFVIVSTFLLHDISHPFSLKQTPHIPRKLNNSFIWLADSIWIKIVFFVFWNISWVFSLPKPFPKMNNCERNWCQMCISSDFEFWFSPFQNIIPTEIMVS